MKNRNLERRPDPTEDQLEGPDKTYRATKKEYEVAQVAYRNRLISHSKWIQAQRDWARAQIEHTQDQYNFLSRRVDEQQFGTYLP